jgi:hypothetical protein
LESFGEPRKPGELVRLGKLGKPGELDRLGKLGKPGELDRLGKPHKLGQHHKSNKSPKPFFQTSFISFPRNENHKNCISNAWKGKNSSENSF